MYYYADQRDLGGAPFSVLYINVFKSERSGGARFVYPEISRVHLKRRDLTSHFQNQRDVGGHDLCTPTSLGFGCGWQDLSGSSETARSWGARFVYPEISRIWWVGSDDRDLSDFVGRMQMIGSLIFRGYS